MLKNSPNIGSGSITVRNDPRVLPFGNFLRKTKINELPQIINVLKGEMSIVGPRPQMKVDFEKFPEFKRDEIYDVYLKEIKKLNYKFFIVEGKKRLENSLAFLEKEVF